MAENISPGHKAKESEVPAVAPKNPYESKPVQPTEATSMIQPGPTVPQTPEPPKKSRKGLIAILVAVILIVAVGTSLMIALWDRIQSSALLQKKNDEEVVMRVLEGMMTIASFDMQATTTQKGEAFGLSRDGEASFEITGVFDSKGKENGNFSLESRASGATSSQKGGIVNIGSRNYLKLSGFSEVPILSEAIEDRWIDLGETQTNPLEPFSGLDLVKLRSSFLKNNVLAVSKNFGEEKVNGKETTHYELSYNRNGMIVFMQDLAELAEGVTLNKEMANKFLVSLDVTKLEVWVGKSDDYPYRIVLEANILENPEISVKNGSLSLSMDLLNVNVQKNIVAPDAESLEEAVAPVAATFVTDLFNGTLAKLFSEGVPVALPDTDGDGLDDAIESLLKTDPNKVDSDDDGENDKEEFALFFEDVADADSDGLADSMETFIGTDPNKNDTDSDGFTDGDELKNGYNPKGAGKLFE